jgi:peptidoglycan hydrolase-like protein with peptidoglycan-binding domain
MPLFDGSVGQGGQNQRHDLACLQATLRLLGLYGGPVDGNWPPNQRPLVAGITAFQQRHRLPVTGRVEKAGPSNQRLESALPPSHKRLAGLRGSTLVAITPQGARPRDSGIEALKLPDPLKRQLTEFRARVARQAGLALRVTEARSGPGGQLELALAVDGLGFLDANQRPLPPSAPPPRAAVDLIRRAGGPLADWRFPAADRLQLVSARPVRLPGPAASARIAPGQGLLTGPVGRAGNAVHDLALVQTALANLRAPGGGSFWSGGVTGRASPALSEAIAGFQAAVGLEPSGSIERGSAAEAKLVALLPTPLKALRCLPGTTAVYRLTLKVTAQALTARNDDKIPLPEPLRGELKALQTRVLDETGIALAALASEVAVDGRPRLHLKPSNVQWIDTNSARPAGDGRPPPELANSLPKTGSWQPSINGPNLQLAQLGADERREPLEFNPSACLQDGTCRYLTPGEIALATTIFGNTIRYHELLLKDWEYLILDWQDDHTYMAPNGNIYFGKGLPFIADFSNGSWNDKRLFIHEMTHVWQVHKLGYSVLGMWIRRMANDKYNYLPLKAGKPFLDYGLEQQPSIVADYFMLMNGQPVQGAPPISVYKHLLRNFP